MSNFVKKYLFYRSAYILTYLLDNPADITTIIKSLGFSRSFTEESVRFLLVNGLIEKEEKSRWKYRFKYCLTKKGKEVALLMKNIISEVLFP